MAQPPAVVIVARHGPRLDAADQQWHLSTPTPYDPPLTYGGWNQCRALGRRIADLLHARQQKLNTPGRGDGVRSQDFAAINANGKRGADGDDGEEAERGESGTTRKKRRTVKHKVVIHSSPFLRCLQTSAAIAAGLAQFSPTTETSAGAKSAVESRSRSPNPLGIASPKLRAVDGGHASPRSGPISESRHHLAHEVARRALSERKKFSRSKLRVDAFLGEWLNPQYFENITPPPPSSMMLKTAKAELMQNEAVEVYTPLITSSGKTSGSSSLWNGGAKVDGLDEWRHIQESLPAPAAKRESRSRASTVGSDSSPVDSGRKSPFRPGSALSPLTSTLPKPEPNTYNPPAPHYAVSSSDQIPRGYVAHARNACTNVDFQWDSSRSPQDWPDGGEYGEEWSSMHRRFRRGLNKMVQWYSQHDADGRGEDALGFDQAERHGDSVGEEGEEEELVVVLVTHGAGCNALIGALTGQPVLLDVGMASLTMAVRKDDAPDLAMYLADGQSPARSPGPNGAPEAPLARRASTDLGLPSLYEMKLVASSEHLRPSSNISQTSQRGDLASVRESIAQYKQRLGSGSSALSVTSEPPRFEPPRSNTSALLGSIRRPSAVPLSAPGSTLPSRMNSSHPGEASPPITQGLWTPPAGRTPLLRPQEQAKGTAFAPLGDGLGNESSDMNLVLDFSNSPPDSRPGTSSGPRPPAISSINGALQNGGGVGHARAVAADDANGDTDGSLELSPKGDELPTALSRGLTGNGLWGNRPSGDVVEHKSPRELGPKRRWTVDDRD